MADHPTKQDMMLALLSLDAYSRGAGVTALGQDVKNTVKPTRKAVGEMEVVG